ncbi:hypothetical protein LHJ74_07355 [Streptomyces sp. N2-109]|uniref:DUF6895 domain-containing protein n=1 Tax=Streptomyces gossypii TaxID=2883101 RepID=A0ABT2JPC9_9ACTN|nr:hypothetical protein [Streptomyces gossypii]MCT2589737.1 hypothetical protein [Streptomyces gossypii]
MSPQLLHRVGAGALEWLAANRTHFRARTDASTSALEIGERFKPIGELAVIGKVLFREGVAGSQQSAIIRKLLDYAWREVLDGGELLAWLQRREPLSPIPLELYVPFQELGYRNQEVEGRARLARGLTSWTALEMAPNRRLGLARVEIRAGLPPSIEVAEAARRTWLGRTPEPWTAVYHIAYDVTHTVFHLTDWGEHPEALPTDIADYLELWLPVWIEDWASVEHWDLLGELLVVDACLPRPTLDPAAWQLYAAAQQPDGAMPVQRTLPPGDPADTFDLAYHPTLVAAFASVMATSRAMTALTVPQP